MKDHRSMSNIDIFVAIVDTTQWEGCSAVRKKDRRRLKAILIKYQSMTVLSWFDPLHPMNCLSLLLDSLFVLLQSCRSTYLFIVCLIIVFKKLKQQRDELQKYQKKVRHIDKE
jgi:hypothetical protein